MLRSGLYEQVINEIMGLGFDKQPNTVREGVNEEMGGCVLLFVREYKNDGFGAAPYTYLGKVKYLQHSDSRPMNILWKLEQPIPAKYIRTTNKLVG